MMKKKMKKKKKKRRRKDKDKDYSYRSSHLPLSLLFLCSLLLFVCLLVCLFFIFLFYFYFLLRACVPLETSVGTKVALDHLAPTPVGMAVTATVTLQSVEKGGRLLVFGFEVRDAKEVVGTGSHTRFVVNVDKFVDGAKSKAAPAPAAPSQ